MEQTIKARLPSLPVKGIPMKARFRRLIETLIAKKYLAWAVATVLLCYGKISGTDWVMLTGAIFCIDAYSKQALLPKGVPSE